MTDVWADRCSRANTIEEALSAITLGAGQLERMDSVSPEDLTRIRQAVIRLSNNERRLAKGEERHV